MVLPTLGDPAAFLFKWFSNNQMKANTEKCHLLSNKNCREEVTLKTTQLATVNSRSYRNYS